MEIIAAEGMASVVNMLPAAPYVFPSNYIRGIATTASDDLDRTRWVGQSLR